MMIFRGVRVTLVIAMSMLTTAQSWWFDLFQRRRRLPIQSFTAVRNCTGAWIVQAKNEGRSFAASAAAPVRLAIAADLSPHHIPDEHIVDRLDNRSARSLFATPHKSSALRACSMIELFGLLLLLPSAHAASFDCRLAKTSVEKTICSDTHLSALDDRLGQAYQDALREAGEGDIVVRRDEEVWLSSLREDCTGEQMRSCIEQRETVRIQNLERTRGFDSASITEYKLANASHYFDFTVRIFAKSAEARDDTREGPGHVLIFLKGKSKPMQTIAMTNIFVSLDKAGQPLVNSAKLYDYQGAINVGDFNFDGHQDIAIQNGNEGSYAGPSYNVYVYAPQSNTFVFSRPMTELIVGSLGFFKVDSSKKKLITLTKSGCCYHQTTKYGVHNDKPVPVEREIEDATKSEKYILVSDQRMIDGKWTKRITKRVPQSQNQ